jgi:hypothetical protein
MFDYNDRNHKHHVDPSGKAQVSQGRSRFL